MDHEKDIIGFMREMRQWHYELKAHGMTDQYAFAEWKDKAFDNFPKIAKAMEIVVEGLEAMQYDSTAHEYLDRICIIRPTPNSPMSTQDSTQKRLEPSPESAAERIAAIAIKVKNARLDWALQSDEGPDLIVDLQFLLDQFQAKEEEIKRLRGALEGLPGEILHANGNKATIKECAEIAQRFVVEALRPSA